MNEAMEPPIHADARRYGEAKEGDGDGEETLYYGGRWGADGKMEVWLRDHTGRDLLRFIVPEVRAEDEEFKVVFTNQGHGRHTLAVDWLPVTMMIPGWAWCWWRIRREIRHFWRMLRR